MRAELFRFLRLLCVVLYAGLWLGPLALAQGAPPPVPVPAPAPPPIAAPLPDAPPAPGEADSPAPLLRQRGRALRGRPLRGPAAAPAPDLTPANVKPFETGIDYQPTSPSTKVTFNLEDADLPELVRMMSQITGRSFILPGKSRSIKATVYAPTKVSAAEAYQAFLSILELNGMALVPAGRYLKIVESGRIEGRAIPLFVGDEAVPTGDRFITRLETVKNITSEDAAQLLERFKSADGSLTAYAPTNMLIMTDTGTNVRRMLRILGVVDVARTGEQIWVEPVHHANASELAARLSEIFDAGGATKGGMAPAARAQAMARHAAPTAPGAAGGTPTATIGGGEARLTKILADERTNSLIIVATESAYLRILEMMKYLDVSMEGEGKIHVHHLQHSDAEEIATTLSNLVGKGGGAHAPGAAAAAGDAGASIFEGKVAVTAHKASNALVITSSTHDYAALKGVIDMLDSERKQVFIEAVIMELNVNRSTSLGLGYHSGIPDVPTNNSLSVVGFNAGRSIGGVISPANADFLTGLAVGVQGPTVTDSTIGLSIPGFGVALHALASSGDANVLSTPHLIASDNVQAEISVGENVPLQTSSAGSLGSLGGLAGLAGGQNAGALGGIAGLSGLAGLAGGGSVPRQDVGTTVQITPHINDASEIRLEISEEISSAGAPSESGNLGVRSVSRTKAKTEVVVRDQQTVVIGGLMRDQVTTGQSKVPILGDIPLIGMLFRTNEKTKTKKNLLLFLTPYIIRTPDDLRAIYERKMRERQEFLDRYFVFNDSNYEAPVDYSRTRGLVAEMMRQIVELEGERKLMADAAARPELKHDARPAVGIAPEGSTLIGPDGDSDMPPGDAVDAPAPMPQMQPVPEAAGVVQ